MAQQHWLHQDEATLTPPATGTPWVPCSPQFPNNDMGLPPWPACLPSWRKRISK